jgi:monoamine oxidase
MNGTKISRRWFLRDLGGLGLLAFANQSLISCSKTEQPSFSGKVCVVGAGAAGLYAAALLKLQGVEVEIWEASDSAFGRIFSNNDKGFPVELGAEEIHGKNSILFEWLIQSGATWSDMQEQEDFFYLDGQLLALSSQGSDPDIKKVRELIDLIASDNQLPDTDPLSWAIGNGLSEKYQNLFNALVGNERGTSVGRLSLKAISEEDRAWSSGEDSIVLTGADYRSLLVPVYDKVKNFIRFDKPVRNIDYRDAQVTLIDWDGNRAAFDKVLVTVPLSMLKQSIPAFNPALPKEKKDAISALGMDAGLKVVMYFRTRFWPPNMGSLFGHPLVPECWVPLTVPPGGPFVLTAFVCGEAAEKLLVSGGGVVREILDGLDMMFSGQASGAFQSYTLMNWKDQPWIGGAYSYAAKNTSGARKNLAAPIDNKVFFAGEATHFNGHNSTVHGAIETAVRATHEMLFS